MLGYASARSLRRLFLPDPVLATNTSWTAHIDSSIIAPYIFALAQRCWKRLRGVDSRRVWDAGYGDVTKGASPRCSERDQFKEDKL